MCEAAAICPLLKKEATASARREFKTDALYDPAELAASLDQVQVIEEWCSSVRKFAYAEAERGRGIPNYKLVMKRATRTWSQDEHTTEVELAMLGLAESDIFKPRVLDSPAQIEKKLKKADRDKLEPLIKKESSGTKLVHVSEKGDPVKRDAASEFCTTLQRAAAAFSAWEPTGIDAGGDIPVGIPAGPTDGY